MTMAAKLNLPLSYPCPPPAPEIALRHPQSLRARPPVPLYPCPNLAIVQRPHTRTMTHIVHVDIRASMQTSLVRGLQPQRLLPDGRRTTMAPPPLRHFHSASRSPYRTRALSHATTLHPNAPS